MAKLLAFEGPYKVGFVEETDVPLRPHQVRVATTFSGISAGTELTLYRGTNPKLSKRWDSHRGVFVTINPEDAGFASIADEIQGRGYEQVGKIVELGSAVEDLKLGTSIYGVWGHRTHAVIDADVARISSLEGIDPILGVFARVGIVALNGILDGQINLGEAVAVFGMGVVGQIVAQLAKLSGARVIVTDPIESRRAMARQLTPGVIVAETDKAASDAIREVTGTGADICFEVAGNTAALQEAIRACAYSARVVSVGFYQGGAHNLFLGEEFHHNRISIIASQISGQNPALQHRWDRQRLLRTFMDYVRTEEVNLAPLITHTAPFNDAQRMFEMVDQQPGEVLQAVFTFPEA